MSLKPTSRRHFHFQPHQLPCTEKGHLHCWSSHWAAPQELPYFKGHFPNRSILPAVATIDASLQLLQQILQKPVELKTILNSKFMFPIEPLLPLQIEVHQTQTWEVRWFSEDDRSKVLANLQIGIAGNN